MSTEEEYKELSAKLRYGLELAEQRLIEETARREGTLCYGRPDGKVVRISATELLKLRQSGGNNAASVAVCTCSEMESGWNRGKYMNNCICIGKNQNFFPMFLLRYSKPRCGCISLLYAKSRRKKYLNLFVSSKKSRTFASRLLSKVYKELILSVLIVLCPGTVRNAGKNCFLVVNI